MKTSLPFFILSLMSLPALGKDLTLSLGETKAVSMKGSPRIWIQDGQIVQAEGSGGQAVLKARREGMTTVRVGGETFKVQVVHPEKREIFKTLSESLSRIVGLSAEITEGDLTVGGRLYRFEEWLRLAETIKTTSVTYQMRAQMSETLQRESQRYFTRLFDKAKLPPQTIIFEPAPEVRVTGSDLVIKKYHQLLRPFGVQVIRDEQSLDIAPTVKVQITVAEVSRDLTLKYGISWPGGYKATLMPNTGTINYADIQMSLLADAGKGKTRILASPNLVCRSGKEAEFLAGGEFPIKIVNYEVHDIIWKRYGILLKVKPKADASGRMSISVDTEVSRVDMARAVDGVPGILTNRVSSHFDLTGPQTIALSGLLKNEDATKAQGLPGISDIPVLGNLFGSKEFADNRTELVIFVRPSIMKESDEFERPSHIGEL